jgi:16S rRNA (guanine527-N7)-methyltransferase
MSAGSEPLAPEGFRALLDRGLPGFGFSLSNGVRNRLVLFLVELDRWRRKMNLTGPLGEADLVSHVLESLLGEHLLDPAARVLDIGTGGGFPGVPLAIARPDVRMTWLEPRGKRAAFLKHIARTIPVENAEVLIDRLENLPDARYDAATSRGVAIDKEIFRQMGFLRPGGDLLLWTTTPDQLVTTLATIGLRLVQVLAIPGSRQRAIGVFRKT